MSLKIILEKYNIFTSMELIHDMFIAVIFSPIFLPHRRR
ncbi:hypothetical protein AXX16_4566 [Serratia rubidaea]|nr:hypothetical protein AXX16_4566 [Serratia rubidaea]